MLIGEFWEWKFIYLNVAKAEKPRSRIYSANSSRSCHRRDIKENEHQFQFITHTKSKMLRQTSLSSLSADLSKENLRTKVMFALSQVSKFNDG